MAPKGGLGDIHPTKQLRTHRARASHATSPHPFTHNSPVQAPNRERFQGRARRCGPGSPARREGPEGRGHARGGSESGGPSWACRRGDEARPPFRPPRLQLLPGRGLEPSHSVHPGPHSFFLVPALRRQAAVLAAGRRSAPAPRCAPPIAGRALPKVGWGRIPPLTSSRHRDFVPLASAAEVGDAQLSG